MKEKKKMFSLKPKYRVYDDFLGDDGSVADNKFCGGTEDLYSTIKPESINLKAAVEWRQTGKRSRGVLWTMDMWGEITLGERESTVMDSCVGDDKKH